MSIKVGVIIGSTRPGRVGDKVAKWYLDQVKGVSGLTFELIDLADENLPILDEAIPPSMGNYQNEHTKKWAAKIASFDAFVWVSAEYNHAAPASLLNAISFVYGEWNRKAVALVSYGGMGGVRAAEHLRQVASELQMADIRQGVMVREPWVSVDETGKVNPDYVVGDPKVQAEDLLWWSNALKTAKA